ncbi:ATP-binding cassette domain-containing protein [Leucobacter komagatae]|nr:ABC transporter ATP-binding protein [Leucobacter komagatae]
MSDTKGMQTPQAEKPRAQGSAGSGSPAGSSTPGYTGPGSPALPRAARRRLALVAAGWALVALVEVAAYTCLALAIRDGGSIALVLTVAAASLLVTVLVSRAGYLAGARLAGDLYAGLGGALNRAKLSWFTPANRALVTTTSGRAIPSLMSVPAHQLQLLVLSPLIPLLLVGAVWIVAGAQTALLVLGLLLAALAVQALAQRALARSDANRHELETAATAATVELVEHLELLRTAAGPTRALERAEAAWAEQERAMARTNRAAAPATLLSAIASALPLAGALLFLTATGGFAEPAAALALLVLTARASAPIDDLALSGIALSELRAHTDAYRAVLGAPALPARADTGPRAPAGHDISVRGLSQAPVLDGVTASIPAGARIHVTGPSGSGKSTLLGLLLRFDDPAGGEITLGGVPLTALSEADITSRVAYVPQDPIVFTGSLADNIRLGDPAASEEELAAAAAGAQLTEVVARDPLGIHQPVGTHGQRLSGGERQRVAIARALLKRAPVLILDEATSALDEHTEMLVAGAFAALDCTLVFVTHRDPSIWHPDHTITLEGPPTA